MHKCFLSRKSDDKSPARTYFTKLYFIRNISCIARVSFSSLSYTAGRLCKPRQQNFFSPFEIYHCKTNWSKELLSIEIVFIAFILFLLEFAWFILVRLISLVFSHLKTFRFSPARTSPRVGWKMCNHNNLFSRV